VQFPDPAIRKWRGLQSSSRARRVRIYVAKFPEVDRELTVTAFSLTGQFAHPRPVAWVGIVSVARLRCSLMTWKSFLAVDTIPVGIQFIHHIQPFIHSVRLDRRSELTCLMGDGSISGKSVVLAVRNQ